MARPRLTNRVMDGLARLAREVDAKRDELLQQIEEIRDPRERREARREYASMEHARNWIERMRVARAEGCAYDEIGAEHQAAAHG
ncbi:MAG: hypothetical protein IT379_39590 [Deltaproteobacteria bacterium]|nr:hypothetical protein [Deltaproteobacteria bacterium]